jgi:hypothetical protein
MGVIGATTVAAVTLAMGATLLTREVVVLKELEVAVPKESERLLSVSLSSVTWSAAAAANEKNLMLTDEDHITATYRYCSVSLPHNENMRGSNQPKRHPQHV